MSSEVVLARVTVVVTVVKGAEPARSTPSGIEPGYEYVCVRDAEPVSAEAFWPVGILSVLDEGYFEDPDPDALLIEAVRGGLSRLTPGEGHAAEAWTDADEVKHGPACNDGLPYQWGGVYVCGGGCVPDRPAPVVPDSIPLDLHNRLIEQERRNAKVRADARDAQWRATLAERPVLTGADVRAAIRHEGVIP